MKRLVALAVVLCLLLCLPAFALDKEAVPGQLLKTAQDFMENEGYNHDVNKEKHYISAQFALEGALAFCDLEIKAYDDMLRVMAYAPDPVPAAQRDEMAKLLALINYEISYATFHMDYEEGELSCSAFQYVESVLPGVKEVEVMVHQPMIYMDKFGDAIVQVAQGKLDAQQAFKMALGD